jgi:hypothetical protein
MKILLRTVLSVFVAAFIVQTIGVSKSFAECPPNCPPPKTNPSNSKP